MSFCPIGGGLQSTTPPATLMDITLGIKHSPVYSITYKNLGSNHATDTTIIMQMISCYAVFSITRVNEYK